MSRYRVILAVVTALLATGSAGEAISLDSPGAVESFSSVSCLPSTAPALALHGGRFLAALAWRDSKGAVQVGYPLYPVRKPPASGFFSFLPQGSYEVAVKVVDGRKITGTFWVFHAGLTNVEYQIWVNDVVTGTCKTYYHPPGEFSSDSDLKTFASPALGLASAASDLVADFSIDPAEPGVREEVTFSDLSKGNPTDWCWHFGDELPNSPCAAVVKDPPPHRYQRTGTFEVKLEVGRNDSTGRTVANTSHKLTVVLCNFVLQGQRQFCFAGGGGSVSVKASSFGCSWNVVNQSLDVIEVTSPPPAPRSRRWGSGRLDFTVLKNKTSRGRSGTLLIAGKEWTVHQLGDPRAPCTSNPTTLCLLNGRFEVRVTFPRQNLYGVRAKSGKDGYFWEFDGSNVELVVKVVDGTLVNGRYWFFYGGLTNQDYDLSVRDSLTGTIKVYRNPSGRLTSGGDTETFSDSNLSETCK